MRWQNQDKNKKGARKVVMLSVVRLWSWACGRLCREQISESLEMRLR